MDRRVVVIAVGNEFRRDDGVAFHVVGKAEPRLPPTVSVIEATGESSRLLDAWEGADAVVVVDAARSGARPGTVHVIHAVEPGGVLGDALRHTRPPSASSTHAAGVHAAVELALVLGRLPARLLVVGVEGQDFSEGAGLSASVLVAVPAAADALVGAVEALRSLEAPAGRI